MFNQTHTPIEVSVCSLNVNRSNTATHAAMHVIREKTDPPFNLLLIQEPWWEKLHNRQATVSFPGWQVILLKSQIIENERPCVTGYYRQGGHLEVTLRTNILSDLNIMILETKRTGDPSNPTRIINTYNQKQLGEQNENIFTIDHLTRIHLNLEIPTIITGDWNTCHPKWDDSIEQ